MSLKILKILCFCLCLQWVNSYTMSDISSGLFEGADSNVAAFGDFNADKLVDVFVLKKKGKQLDLLIAEDKKTSSYKTLTLIPSSSNVIKSVVPGDYNGDTQMDVLVTHGEPGNITVEIYWGISGSKLVAPDNTTKINDTLKDEPLVLDWDGNMIPDLLAETSNGKRMRWMTLATKDKPSEEFVSVEFPKNKGGQNFEPFRVPHSNAFVDINGDLSADLVITTEKNFEIWMNQGGNYVLNTTIPLPVDQNSDAYIGQATWADINQDSEPELLLPLCSDKKCEEQSQLHVYHKGNWQNLTDIFLKAQTSKYGYVIPEENPATEVLGLNLPVTLRLGDFDMDGFPDILVLLKQIGAEQDQGPSAYLLMNVACTKAGCSDLGRTYNVLWSSEVSQATNAIQVTFFDIYEDGVLDMLLVVKGKAANNEDGISLHAYKNGYSADACFMKITVVSGLCYNDCPNGRTPFGVNQPGVAVKYDTTKPNGAPTKGCATQLSQSAHFALQLPYTLFGLGQMPNFVDQLYVGTPTPNNTKPLNNSWPQIIPNTQLIVIPNPIDQPRYWNMKLYVKPSEAILITGLVLVGCLGLTSTILGGLHWRERKEDKEEKKQEAQKFHFDAM